jgi:two-component system sensor histidine kinase PilS (NtrC family)
MGQTLRMLRWLYAGRLTVAAGIFSGALYAWTDATADTTLIATLVLVTSLAVTFASVWYTEILQRLPSSGFLYGQVVFDTLLVTAITHITTTASAPSELSPLYILVIAAGALLLPLPGGILIGVLASVLYVGDIFWLQPLFEPSASLVRHISLFTQIGLFIVVAAVTAALGNRLRRAGTQIGAMESELHQLRLDTHDILATLETGLVTVDGAGRLVIMNAAARALLGIDDRAWRGKRVLDELDRVVPGLGEAVRRTADTRAPIRRHEIRRHGVEGDRFLGMRTTVLERKSQQPWVTAVMQDITESKEIEELLRRAERLQAVAELGASLAHEIKNPLASIRSAVEQLAADRVGDSDRTVLRKLVLSESDRLSRLLSEFMEFSRVELRRWNRVDLREVVSGAVGLAAQHPDAVAGARIDLQQPPEPVMVDGDLDLLHRAVFNLVLNAVQHAGQRGQVKVEIGRVTQPDLPASIAVESPVRVTVHDSGPGIPVEDIPRLFDPFFTTRRGGNGLGLAMVHRAVEAHRGAILVNGSPGEGATFTVYLPGQAVTAVESRKSKVESDGERKSKVES